jgi:hypothetical protein
MDIRQETLKKRRNKMSTFTDARDWFVLKILPVAIGLVAEVIRKQAALIPGLLSLIGIVQPYIQAAYDEAVASGDLKMQAIHLAVLSKLFLMELVVPGVEVLSPEDAGGLLSGMASDVMDELGEGAMIIPPAPAGN